MNHSGWPDQSRVYSYGSANVTSIPWETDINRDAGYPVSEAKSGPTSPSTAREVISNYPTPNVPEIITPTFHGIAKHRGCGYTIYSWIPEFVCCIIGMLAMIGQTRAPPPHTRKLTVPADVIILDLADGQLSTKIIHHITINSLIQFITSVAKFAFMVPIVSVLGQRKWLWFKDDARPLTDFQLHDGAGSGGLESLKFSLTLRMLFKSPIAWLAAIVALSGFFTSPLTQQAVGYVSDRQALSNGTASVLRASTFSRSDATVFKPVHGDELLVQTAYLTAVYLGPNQTLPGVDPICSSGDCDWPIYGSLGICAEIVNISASTNSSLLSWLQEVFLIEIQKSQYATVISEAGSAPYYLAVLIPLPDPSTEFKEAPPQTVISQAFVGYFNNPVRLTNDTDLATILYIGVSLYFCTQSFSTTVKGGIHNTSELAYNNNNILSSSTTESMNSYWNLALYGNPICDPGPLTGSTITLSGAAALSNETYTIDFCTGVYLSGLYIIGTSGGILLDLGRSITDVVGQISQALGIAIYGDFNSSTIPDPATQYGNIKLMMENIGKSLTSYMRNEGPTFPNQDNSTITGTAYAQQTLIRIRWPYLSLLAAQLGLTIIVLLFTIVATYRSRMQILKGNSLATMCALSQGVKAELGGMEDMERLKRRANGMRVALERGMDGEVRGLDAA